jgi:hypothetical protein
MVLEHLNKYETDMASYVEKLIYTLLEEERNHIKDIETF